MTNSPDPILETDNFVTVFNCCKDALVNKKMMAIIGAPGFGKTTAIESFQRRFHDNAVIIKAQKSMTAKIFFSSILNSLGDENYSPSMPLYFCIRKAASYFNNETYNKLLIVDEAGKFKPPMLEYMHEFRDLTKDSTGIILTGVEYFRNNMNNWVEQNITGIPEIFSRINSWQQLKPPTTREIFAIIQAYGIEDRDFIKEHRNISDYRILVNKIKDYLLLINIKSQKKKKRNGVDMPKAESA